MTTNYNKRRATDVRLTMKEEAEIRREINRGDDHDAICARWGIKIARLRKVNMGPLKNMGYAIEAYLK